MRVESTLRRHLGEQRRYFPDWTDHLLESGIELEADRNSYLAGGYAEEFGYRTQSDCSRGVPVLDGESPELCREWRCLARAIHPGYPLRPGPFAADLDSIMAEQAVIAPTHAASEPTERSTLQADDAERHGKFMSIAHRRHERERGTAIVSTRVIAALLWLHRFVQRRLS
jgi:hypothetical protein